MAVGMLAFKLTCVIILTPQVLWYHSYEAKRPTAQVSLVDLVSHDLASHYLASHWTYILVSIPIELDLLMPQFAAEVLVFIWFFFTVNGLTYLTTSISVRYSLTYYKTTSLFYPILTDVEAQHVIRALTAALAIFLLAIRQAIQEPGMVTSMLIGKEAKALQVPVVGLSLSIIAVVTNIAFRILIFMEKRKTDQALGCNPPNSSHQTFHSLAGHHLALAGFILSLGAATVALNLLPDVARSYLQASPVMLASLCLVVPPICIHRNAGLRSFVVARMKRRLTGAAE